MGQMKFHGISYLSYGYLLLSARFGMELETKNRKKFKNLNFITKEIMCKIEVEGEMVAKEIIIIKKKASTLYMYKKKDTSKASQKSATSHPSQS